jgi:hypothetical protein
VAAIHHDILGVDEARTVAGEEDRSLRDIATV